MRRYRRDREEQQNLEENEEPETSWAFYRKHTENLLRRYMYASLQVGRTPNLLDEPVGRGWASSSRIRTFEDALIFVLDIERCLGRLNTMDRTMIQRMVLQEYSHTEMASMLRMGQRQVFNRLHRALDRLTEQLVTSRLLVLSE